MNSIRQKLLLISHRFPPIQTPESIMAFNSTKYLPDLGLDVIVLCAKRLRKYPVDSSILSNLSEYIHIYRTYSPENIILDILNNLNFLPDSTIGWVPFTIKKGRDLLRREKIDVIVSRSAPVTSHFVALKLKRFAGVPWIACFSDPWTQNPYITYPNKLFKKFDEYLERRIIFSADRVIVTTDQTKELFIQRYEEAKDKFVVVPNSYDPLEFLENEEQKTKGTKLIITYAGNWYGIRSPEPLFKALRLLDDEEDITSKIIVRLIGSIGRFRHLISKYKLNQIVYVIDTLPRKDLFTYLFDSDILLLIDAPSDGPSIFLPVKLIEYIAMKKPILAITPEGASADVVRLTKTGVVIPPADVEGIKDAIKNYYEQYKMANLKITPNLIEIEKYSAKNYAKTLVTIIEGLI